MNTIKKLGIVCGSGNLPSLVIKEVKKYNIPFILAGVRGFAKYNLLKGNNYFWVGLGQLGFLGETFKKEGVTHICFAGAVKRPSLFNLKLDRLGKELFVKYFKNISGDDSILSLVIKVYEERYGFKVVAPQFFNKKILSCSNFNSHIIPSQSILDDIKLGFKVAKSIGKLDIGQSVIIQQHMVIAVEGVEGTQNLIKRSKKLLKKGGNKGILVKVKKPYQENRIDLPTIGIKTIKAIYKAGLAGLAIEEGSTLVLDKEEVLNYANSRKLIVLTLNESILSHENNK